MNTNEILRALISDVEAMRTQCPPDREDFGDPEEEQHWFGPFTEGHFDTESYSGHSIQWPNLGILIDQAKTALPAEQVNAKLLDALERILYAHEAPPGAAMGEAKLCPMFAELARSAIASAKP